jgi:tetraprenyl-beta-curcumene synthase
MSSPGLALAAVNGRYWTTVAHRVRAQLRRWERRAREIPDPALQAIALGKLRDERFNAEVAATLATLAPRAHRAHAVEAIVALELMYDYLDGLTEQPAQDPLRSGRELFGAFTDAFAAADVAGTQTEGSRTGGSRTGGAQTGDWFRLHPSDDGGYLAELSATVSAAVVALPAWEAVSATACASAARCAEAQVRAHAAGRAGTAQLEEWATAQAAGTGLQWREYMAGAVSSVLTVHALIAAAANERTTPAEAAAIDSAYLSIAALSTMLDGAIDYEQDNATGEGWYMGHYESIEALADRAAETTSEARRRARALPNAAHHTMTLVGLAAYYTSARAATHGIAAPVAKRVHGELGALMAPTVAVMRAWRAAKLLRRALPGTFAMLAVAAAVPAIAARTLNITDTAHLRFVRETAASTLIDEGRATGGLPGKVRVVFEVGAKVKASFTIAGRNGSLIGGAVAKPHQAKGDYTSFAGTLTITHGTGRYLHAHGQGGFYGTIDRANDAVTVQTTGALAY